LVLSGQSILLKSLDFDLKFKWNSIAFVSKRKQKKKKERKQKKIEKGSREPIQPGPGRGPRPSITPPRTVTLLLSSLSGAWAHLPVRPLLPPQNRQPPWRVIDARESIHEIDASNHSSRTRPIKPPSPRPFRPETTSRELPDTTKIIVVLHFCRR
jgi:hypothetical protein